MAFLARSTAWAVAFAVLAIADIRFARAQSILLEETRDVHGLSSNLELTPSQRNAIYQEVHKGATKVVPSLFGTRVGSDVPAIIDLYTLPDDILAANPSAQSYKYTEVDDQIVLIDPTKMRVIAVIGPRASD